MIDLSRPKKEVKKDESLSGGEILFLIVFGIGFGLLLMANIMGGIY